jgi:hypothetical protein
MQGFALAPNYDFDFNDPLSETTKNTQTQN